MVVGSDNDGIAAYPGREAGRQSDARDTRILIVEDDAALARAIQRNLELRGYLAEWAPTLAMGIASLRRSCPAVVILDIELPDGSGWDILRLLRSGTCTTAAVIVMSAFRPNARLSKKFLCEAVLEKPFPMQSLLRLVAENLDHMGVEGVTRHPDRETT